MKISQINIFPIKSLDGYSPTTAEVQERGLAFDRRWMIVDNDGMFFTQRTQHNMATLRAEIIDNQLIITKKNTKVSIAFDVNQYTNQTMQVVVWDDTVEANLVNNEVDAFLTKHLETDCRLVIMLDSSVRRVEEDFNTGEDEVSFADGYPFLIIGENSLNDLNTRLESPLNADNQVLVGLRRFRANFIFSGGKPYEEETWSDFEIGNVRFSGIKPCGRCVMTTLNPDTGESTGKEPLATLSTYRKFGRKITFGQNLIWNKKTWNGSDSAFVNVGDEIKLTK